MPSNDDGAHLNRSWFQHISNIFGVSNNLHLTELFAILRDPSPQRITFFGAILNPATFPIVQIEASAAIKLVKDEAATARSSAQALGTSCKKSRLSEFLGMTASWSPLKIGSKAIAKRKPLAGQPCLIPLAIKNCPRSAPAN